MSEPELAATPPTALPQFQSSSSQRATPEESKNAGLTSFWIEPPALSEEQKQSYRASDIEWSSHPPVDQVVGQYPVKPPVQFYFARLGKGLAYRVRVYLSLHKSSRRDSHPHYSLTLGNFRKNIQSSSQIFVSSSLCCTLFPIFLTVTDVPSVNIERAKRERTLPISNFDPSKDYVHPSGQLTNLINLQRRRASVLSTISGEEVSTPPNTASDEADQDAFESSVQDDNGTDSDSEDTDSGGYESSDVERPTRRSNRNQKKAKSTPALPFSPRKTRSVKVAVMTDDDGDESEPQRRSTRSKTIKVSLNESDEDYNEEEEHDSDGDFEETQRKGEGKKEIDYDDESDEETAVYRNHRPTCEKCGDKPAHELLAKIKKKKVLYRFSLKCPVVSHWKCTPGFQREQIISAVHQKDIAAKAIEVNETTEFICGSLMYCFECEKPVVFDAATLESEPGGDVEMADETDQVYTKTVFRCFTCKRPGHYHCLPHQAADGDSDQETAEYYQKTWTCHDCQSFVYPLDKIIAWRPFPRTATEAPWPADDRNYFNNPLPREYLVKWADRSYRRAQWVPHMWLLQTNQQKLRHFILHGSSVELVEEEFLADEMDTGTGPPPSPRTARTAPKQKADKQLHGVPPVPNAFDRISPAWKEVDRILDLRMWNLKALGAMPKSETQDKSELKKKTRMSKIRIASSDEEETSQVDKNEDSGASEFSFLEQSVCLQTYEGDEPPGNFTWTLKIFESKMGREVGRSAQTSGKADESTTLVFRGEDCQYVAWALIKWNDLGYEDATWDSALKPTDPAYPSFQNALKRYRASLRVTVPKRNKREQEYFESRKKGEYFRIRLQDAKDLELGQDEKYRLMDFQVDGFNWLCNNWWNHQPSILADEMGLGKTVQIASFLGEVITKYQASPALVVVPNATIGNWVREFERWAPVLTVVPFYGEAKARTVIKATELQTDQRGITTTGQRFHVIIATYETLTGTKDFTSVFKNQHRWEILVIDEGQRLKSDSSLLFRRLNELNVGHRILMTGTPLNNNIRELFNLMNFLDPEVWNDLEGLESQYGEVTEELVMELRAKLRPYFLRRIKSEVVKLPPKNEVIIPISMTPLQKRVYKAIVAQNANLFNTLFHKQSKAGIQQSKAKINNLLMEMRKVVQHPYLHDDAIEDTTLSPQEIHERLIDASGKLRFLRMLLPKLKARGHRVLLFSQFKLALNIVEDFLIGEGYKYLRLDGDVSGPKRQRGMDAFNKPGSDYFIYLLTTRAGGVGINLFTADTVIIFDPDFNPHQDLQAIARAHRFGQKKTCLVFKLMVKDSAEEGIMQKAKGKLVLDHVIVQQMDDEDEIGDDLNSLLARGAQALFDDEQGARDINYTDNDVLKLLEKTESMIPDESTDDKQPGAMSFAFAKVWTAEQDALQEIEEDTQVDSWAETLKKITEERDRVAAEEAAQFGRGARRAAAVAARQTFEDGFESPAKPSESKRARSSEGSAYGGSQPGADSDSDDSGAESAMSVDISMDAAELKGPKHHAQPGQTSRKLLQAGYDNTVRNTAATEHCGLCHAKHGLKQCPMLENTQHLVEYRMMLLDLDCTESDESRIEAIRVIDHELSKRDCISYIAEQPLHPVARKPAPATLPQKARPPNRPIVPPKQPAFPPAPTPPLYTPALSHQQIGYPGPPVASGSRPAASSSYDPLSGRPVKKLRRHCPICGNGDCAEITSCRVVSRGPAGYEFSHLLSINLAHFLFSFLFRLSAALSMLRTKGQTEYAYEISALEQLQKSQ
ncbi:SNF2 family DNA-dependent ATPase [Flagelloscypha sp. PMI_526]|nr:SNF2 family DNA-dependent ATPase [Flagelloscypha sp. PMI_526]